MNATHDDPTRARAALEQAATTRVGTDRDRRIHALATAGFGLAVGAYVSLNPPADRHTWFGGVLFALYVATLFALAAWQRHAARTVPRHSRMVGYAGLAAMGVLALGSIMWLNVRQGDNRTAGLPDQLEAWWVYVLVRVVIALPMLVAGHVIQRSRS